MNFLIDKLPHHVDIDGVKYSINHDFKTSIRFELLIQNNPLPPPKNPEHALKMKEIVEKSLLLYYDTIPHNVDLAIDKILWFYRGGIENQSKQDNQHGCSIGQRLYSFDYDKAMIFSAFYQQYGLDLTEKNLHWWTFKALFENLTDDTLFGKVKYYRGVEINSNMSKSEQKRIRKLKEFYALPLTESEQKQLEEFENALANGDISQFEEGQSCNLMEV
jgi:hypothetical protein